MVQGTLGAHLLQDEVEAGLAAARMLLYQANLGACPVYEDGRHVLTIWAWT